MIEFLLQFVFEMGILMTGEGVLYLVTLGRRKPEWIFEGNGESKTGPLFMETSFYIGLLTWMGILSLIVYIW